MSGCRHSCPSTSKNFSYIFGYFFLIVQHTNAIQWLSEITFILVVFEGYSIFQKLSRLQKRPVNTYFFFRAICLPFLLHTILEFWRNCIDLFACASCAQPLPFHLTQLPAHLVLTILSLCISMYLLVMCGNRQPSRDSM